MYKYLHILLLPILSNFLWKTRLGYARCLYIYVIIIHLVFVSFVFVSCVTCNNACVGASGAMNGALVQLIFVECFYRTKLDLPFCLLRVSTSIDQRDIYKDGARQGLVTGVNLCR